MNSAEVPPPAPYRKPTAVPAGAVRGQRVLLGAPAGLELEVAGRADRGRRCRRRGDVRVGRRVVGLLDAGVLQLVAVVAGGEHEADALGRALQEHLLVGRDAVGRLGLLDVAPGVGDDLRVVVADDPGQRVEQVVVEAAARAVVADVRSRCHGVDGLDVEGLLAVPAGRAADAWSCADAPRIVWVNWPGAYAPSPCILAYLFASVSMVGAA